MKRFLSAFDIVLLVIVFALITRPYSLGKKLEQSVTTYSSALNSGNPEDALCLMSFAIADGLSPEFLLRLEGITVPSYFRYDGSDSHGYRMVGFLEDSGSRVIWFSAGENGLLVTKDTAIDNILGSAVFLCRENALLNPEGCCPVSGQPYEYNTETGFVICNQGHLGEGIEISSDECFLQRDSVAIELNEYINAGYSMPENLEEMFTVSGEEYGRRGGYRCPDNFYKYYELRDGVIFCPFHEEYSEIVVLP